MSKVPKKWGWYKVLAEGKGYKVKLMYLKPFGKTSYQRHKYRSEIWIFPGRRKAETVKKHQWHQLKNPSGKALRLIEVQTGICRERDVERKPKSGMQKT